MLRNNLCNGMFRSNSIGRWSQIAARWWSYSEGPFISAVFINRDWYRCPLCLFSLGHMTKDGYCNLSTLPFALSKSMVAILANGACLDLTLWPISPMALSTVAWEPNLIEPFQAICVGTWINCQICHDHTWLWSRHFFFLPIFPYPYHPSLPYLSVLLLILTLHYPPFVSPLVLLPQPCPSQPGSWLIVMIVAALRHCSLTFYFLPYDS